MVQHKMRKPIGEPAPLVVLTQANLVQPCVICVIPFASSRVMIWPVDQTLAYTCSKAQMTENGHFMGYASEAITGSTIVARAADKWQAVG